MKTLPVAGIAVVVSPRTGALMIVGVMTGLFLSIFGLSLYQSRATKRSRGGHEPAELAAAAAVGTRPLGRDPARRGSSASSHPMARRDFFRRGLLAALGVFLAEFGGASLAFLWPNLKGQFGSKVSAGSLSDIKSFIEQNNQPFYFGAGRFYVVPYNGTGTNTIYKGLVQDDLMALYQKCVHLGCRVPFCQASQWFECPCHGSKYNRAGEYELGPAPRGLDRFKLTIGSGGEVSVDTSTVVTGPPRGTNTTKQAPEGPFCVGGAAAG